MKISDKILQELIQRAGRDSVKADEPMKLHTTMKVGGSAAYYTEPGNEECVRDIIAILKHNDVPYYILGNGSNVIFRDEGYEGAVICLSKNFTGYTVLEETSDHAFVSVKAGTQNRDFAMEMMSLGLSGFEFASGIPGSVGGATAMNAGAYDGEIRYITDRVRLLDKDNIFLTKTCSQMDFGYRHSAASSGDLVVMETVFLLKKDDPQAIMARIEDLDKRRKEKQPLEYPSCGSAFKRPEGYFAGKLISDAGLKGAREGGAMVSEKHAGFIINADNASAADVIRLIEMVRERVYETQGVLLECEVKII
mgnify:CR=1 FL=1